MKSPDPTKPDLIQTVFTAARLISDDEQEAARLVERVFSESDPVSVQQALHTLRQISRSPSFTNGGILANRLRQSRMDQVVEHVLAGLPGERRLDVLDAWMHPDAPGSEWTVFKYAVKRAMGADASENDISASLRRVLGPAAVPVPPSLRKAVESTLEARRSPDIQPAPVKSTRSHPAIRFGGAIAVILIASLIGIWIGAPGDTAAPSAIAPSNLFEVMSTASTSEFLYTGSSRRQAERMIQDQFDERVLVPALLDGTLEGLSSGDLGGILSVPVLHYQSNSGIEHHIFVISYRLLNEFEVDFSVSPDVLAQLASDDGVDLAIDGEHARIVWRTRDDVYTVFTSDPDPTTVRSRFSFK